ncbi:MAG: hypothetical protein Q7J34_08490 [Bacteroidales bacterium]|jgi:hypothetical protein|nr:hypothetical protein [Bacteroidales bacterium]
MKGIKFYFAAIALIVSFLSVAQENVEIKKQRFLLDDENGIQITGFGAPIFEFSEIDNDLSVCMGGGGAVMFNQQFYIGGYGMGLVPVNGKYNFSMRNFINGQLIQYSNLSPIFAHGGLWLGYIHDSDKIVHYGLSTKIGWGTLGFVDLQYNIHDSEIGIDPIFVITPQAEIEINMLKWFKVNFGLGYHYVGGVDATYVNNDNKNIRYYDKNAFNSLTGSVTLLFGGFERK